MEKPFVPRLHFRDDVRHYQKIEGKQWTSYTMVAVRADGWVDVIYQDGARVAYPPSAFDMIVERPGETS